MMGLRFPTNPAPVVLLAATGAATGDVAAPASPAPTCSNTPDAARTVAMFRALVAQWPDGAESAYVEFDPCATTRLAAYADRYAVHLDLHEMAGAPDAALAFVIGHELGHVLQIREGSMMSEVYARETLADLAAFALMRGAGLGTDDLRPVLAFLASRDSVAHRMGEVRSALAIPDRDARFAALERLIPGLGLIRLRSKLGRVIVSLAYEGWPRSDVQL